jgi:division protein CdvB (Snf7/Vps24/ESCRT-III family)
VTATSITVDQVLIALQQARAQLKQARAQLDQVDANDAERAAELAACRERLRSLS